jgi:hypothetical protein
MAAEDELLPQRPMVEDASPTPAAVEPGATSDGEPSGDESVGDQSGSDSSASEEERPPIAAIVAHRDTKGQPWDPVPTYYTVQYAGLDGLGEDGEEEELPEDEVMLRAGKILREYRRGVAGAASAAASAAAEAASSPQGQAGAAQRSKKRARGAGEARGGGAWTEGEVAQVVELGRELRGQGVGEAGFEGLAEQLGRTAKAVYGKWLKTRTPSKHRASGEGGGGASKARRVTQTGGGLGRRAQVEEELAGGCGSSTTERSLRNSLWHAELECAGLRSEVRTLRECLALLGMRGIDRRGGVGADRGWRGLPRSTSRSPPRNPNDPFASQHLASGY